MRAAEAAGRIALTRRTDPAGGAPQPRRRPREPTSRQRASETASARDAKGPGRGSLRVDLTRGRIVGAENVVDRVLDPLLDVSGQVVDAVRRAPLGKRADRGELGEAVAVVGDVVH